MKTQKTTPRISKEPEMRENVIVRTLVHNGVSVSIKIDYDNGNISLVEKGTDYNPKPYVFGKRTLDYMQGWINILEAMRLAVEYGKKELEKRAEIKTTELVGLVAGDLAEIMKKR